MDRVWPEHRNVWRNGDFERHFVWTRQTHRIYMPDTDWCCPDPASLEISYVLLVKPWFTWTTSDQNKNWHSTLRRANSKSNCY
jgi:hypothetical protein